MFSFPDFNLLYSDFEQDTTEYPYIPGFLAFKEIPVYTKLFQRLKDNQPNLWPELLLVDGNGVLHTRNFGCASHIGVLQNIPTIGVGKTVFYIDGITKSAVKALSSSLNKGGEFMYLTGDSGKQWGAALKATDDSTNPLIVSIGHRVSLDTAIECTKACIVQFRVPEPIRQADLRSREKVKEVFDKKH